MQHVMADSRGSEMLAADIIRAKADAIFSDSHVPLATRGPHKLSVSLGAQQSNNSNSPVPASEFNRFQQTLGLSAHQTKLAAQFLRSWKGRSSIESGLTSKLYDDDHRLQQFFSCTEAEFDVSKSERALRPVVYCSDTGSLMEFLLHHRQVESEGLLAKVGIDGGGGFMKVCLNLLSVTEHSSDQPGSRGSYAQGACSSIFRDSSVKKLILLAIVPEVAESYGNLETILQLLNLDGFNFALAVDMKLANAVLGLQSASSTHPCPWCDLGKPNFNRPDRIGELRSFGAIREHASSYLQLKEQQSAAAMPSAAAFKNCVRMPLLDCSDETLTLDILPPMELHLLLGIVNRLYKELDNRLIALRGCHIRAADWASALNLREAPHHGGQFSGNACSKLLENVELLESMLRNAEADAAMPVAKTFRAFRVVQQTCFTTQLGEGFDRAVSKFAEAYVALGIKVTPKAHAVFRHVSQFLKRQQRKSAQSHGLGFWSEQASEAAHADFVKLWEHSYKVTLSHPKYPSQLLRCTVVYNSRRM
jgi:hypothetical protein